MLTRSRPLALLPRLRLQAREPPAKAGTSPAPTGPIWYDPVAHGKNRGLRCHPEKGRARSTGRGASHAGVREGVRQQEEVHRQAARLRSRGGLDSETRPRRAAGRADSGNRSRRRLCLVIPPGLGRQLGALCSRQVPGFTNPPLARAEQPDEWRGSDPLGHATVTLEANNSSIEGLGRSEMRVKYRF